MVQTLPNQSRVSAISRAEREHSGSSKISSLVGLKFFLILAVVFNHGRIFFENWQSIECPLNLSLAVSCFFVLSGFLLSFSKSRQLDKQSVLNFYARRIVRIWPGHVFSLILLLALLPSQFSLDKTSLEIFLANLFLVQAWIPKVSYFFSFNSPAWSMSTLMFFYLCFPFMSATIKSRFGFLLLPVSIVVILSVACLSRYHNLPESSSNSFCIKGLMYVSPLSRILEFIAGMLLCEFFKNKIGTWRPKVLTATAFELVAALLFFCISIRCDFLTYSVAPYVSPEIAVWLRYCGFSLIPILLLVLALSFQTGVLSKLLSTKPLVFLGEISFSIYLLHMVLLQYFHYKLPYLSSLSASCLFLGVLFAGAFSMHTLVEKPIRQMKLARMAKL